MEATKPKRVGPGVVSLRLAQKANELWGNLGYAAICPDV